MTGLFGTSFRDRIVISDEAFVAGFSTDALAMAQGRRPDARYGLPFLFQNPREVRLGMRFTF